MGSYPIETSLCELIKDDNETSGMVQIENTWTITTMINILSSQKPNGKIYLDIGIGQRNR
jgi:hypothetical protein